jgi:hypothetical protein
MRHNVAVTGLCAMLLAANAPADWKNIELGIYSHGRVLNDQALGPVTAKAVNFHDAESQLVAFDTRKRGTRDPDLEGPNGKFGHWSAGNVNPDEVAGTVMILQETGQGFAGYINTDPMVVAQPDDEERDQNGKRPGAGEITFQFDQMVLAFRFTMLDVEQTHAFMDRTASYVVFSGGDRHVKIAFAELIDPDSVYYDPTITFGDHSANRFPPITAEQLGLLGIERVVINLGGSGAVGGLSYLEEREEIGAANFFREDGFGSGDVSYSPYGSEGPGGGPPGSGGGGPSPEPNPKNPGDPIDPAGVPTPGAAIAGMVIMSLLAGRRPSRRRSRDSHAADDQQIDSQRMSW